MTFKLDSDLSAVNAVLAAIGQAPVTYLVGTNDQIENPEVAMVKSLIDETTVDVQNEEWQFNTEKFKPYTAEVQTDGTRQFVVPANALRMNLSGGQVYNYWDIVPKNYRLYNKVYHTTDVRKWKNLQQNKPLYFDMVWRYDFDELPPVFQRYVTLRASQRAATQLVSNSELTKLLVEQVQMARAACIEYDCNQGDTNFMGWPTHTAYRSYMPFNTLAR